MPFYYDTCMQDTTHGTTATEKQLMLFLTAANQESAGIRAVYGTCRFGTAGGAGLRLKTAATAGSGGTSRVPAKRHSSFPAAGLVCTDNGTTLTPGTTLTQRLAIGMAQTGGQGGWCAMEPQEAIGLKPNAGANGNAELYSIATGVTVPLDVMVVHAEGQ